MGILNSVVNTGDSLNSTVPATSASPVSMPSRPIISPSLPVNLINEVNTLKNKLNPPLSTGTAPINYGMPRSLLSLTATQEPAKQQDRVMSQVIITFTRDANDLTFAGVRIWFVGYKGSTTPLLMASGSASPIIFLCEATGEKVTVLGQLVGQSGITQGLTSSASTTVTLNGQTQAPPAPSISQSLIGTSLGYQFSFNQIPSQVADVIDGYNIYRNTTGVLDGSQTKIQYLKNNPQSTGATVVTDTIVPAVGVFYYYWVSAVDTQQLESPLTAAQSGPIAGSVGSIPPTNSGTLTGGFTWSTTSSAITFVWPTAPIYRADGTIFGTLVAGTQAVTGLQANQSYFAYPYWNEATQALAWVGSELVFPIVTDVTLNGSTGYIKTTNSTTTPSVFSIECWVNIGTNSGTYGLVDLSAPQTIGTGTASTIQLYITSGVVYFGIHNTTPAWVSINTSGGAGWTNINDGAWHHIVATYSAGTSNIYVDNTLFVTSAAMGTIAATASLFWHLGVVQGVTGAPNTANKFLTGSLSNVAVYPSSLTASQINNHFVMGVNVGFSVANSYNSVITGDSPTSFWMLNEPSGTSAADSIGTNTGTYEGGFTLNQQTPIVVPTGTPAILWPYKNFLCTQAQTLRNRIPLSVSSLNPSTTASGSGSGGGGGTGGGGRGGCFSPNTLVKTQRGDVPIEDIVKGDLVLTAKNTWCPVKSLISHGLQQWSMLDMGSDELVTLRHFMLNKSKWKRAWDCIDAPSHTVWSIVHNLEIETDEPETNHFFASTEHSYTLANGRVVHNAVPLK